MGQEDMTETETVPEVTWAPTAAQLERCRLRDFQRWLEENRGVPLGDYRALWRWSVQELSEFWGAVREYFAVIGDGFDGPALVDERMPGAEWYPHARLNFAENVVRHGLDPALADKSALVAIAEDFTRRETTWRELRAQVASFAANLRKLGVEPGDRVAAVLPNIPETVIALLGTACVGAVWTVNSPELSPAATLDRLGQLEPKVLIGVDGYIWAGREFDCRDRLAEVEAGLATLEHTILVRNANLGADGGRRLVFEELVTGETEPSFHRVPFDHPLWVLFSSGTTGAPKGIVHGHGGMTLEALKNTVLNQDMGPGDLYYVAANTSWMVWNTLVNNLMSGASIVTYPGSPTYPCEDRQFEIIARTAATMFATGAAYLTLCAQSGTTPARRYDLSSLRAILSTGSPLPDATWRWVHEQVKADVHLGSDSGGTDICSGFIGSNPLEPVRLGELQGPLLGVAVESWSDDGARVVGRVGEMVITRPMPSMPVYFWGDTDGQRYRSSYFERFPGVWTQGDWITETPRGSFVVHGRSDATLNRGGVRLGSADIYAALQRVPEVRDSMVIGVEEPGGAYYMPLFVVLDDGQALTEELAKRIRDTIRSRTSPRHVPDEIVAAPAIPYTHAHKKIEVPIKRLFAGHDPDTAVNRGSLTNPEAVDWYIQRAKSHRAARSGSASPH